MPEFVSQHIVEFAHTDMAGIVHFAEYFRYLEAAEHAFYRSTGLSIIHQQPEHHISWPRVNVGFDYHHPLRFEDTFTIHLSTSRIGQSSATFRARIMRGEQAIATGHSTSVCCEILPDGMRSIDIPPELRTHLESIHIPQES